MSVITANATSESEVLDGVHGQLFIGGEWIDGEQGTIDVRDPATGEVIKQIANGSVEDGVRALDAGSSWLVQRRARRSSRSWSGRTGGPRRWDTGGPWSPPGARSILMTSAPNSVNRRVAAGPARY